MRTRLSLAVATVMVFALTVVPAASAHNAGTAGQGWWGESTDKQVTSTMFIVIGFFPVLILVLSLVQRQLDKRKHARQDAAKARSVNADWRGGW